MKSIWLHSLIFKLPPQIHFTLKPLKAETKQYQSAKHASSSPVLCGIVFVKPKVVTRCFFTHFPCCFCPPPSPHPPLTRSKSQFGHNSFCNVLNIYALQTHPGHKLNVVEETRIQRGTDSRVWLSVYIRPLLRLEQRLYAPNMLAKHSRKKLK